MSVNRQGVAKLFRQIDAEFAKHSVEVQVKGVAPQARQSLSQLDALLLALHAEGNFGRDRVNVIESANAAGLDLDSDEVREIYGVASEDGYVESMGMAGSGRLTSAGRRRVETLEVAKARSGDTYNTFTGPVTNSQISTGNNSVQNQTNNIADVVKLAKLVELAHEFDTAELSKTERLNFADDIEVIETQIAQPSARVPGYRRAMNGMRTILAGAASSTISRGALEIIDSLAF